MLHRSHWCLWCSVSLCFVFTCLLILYMPKKMISQISHLFLKTFFMSSFSISSYISFSRKTSIGYFTFIWSYPFMNCRYMSFQIIIMEKLMLTKTALKWVLSFIVCLNMLFQIAVFGKKHTSNVTFMRLFLFMNQQNVVV